MSLSRLEKLDAVLDILLLHEGVSYIFLMQEIKRRNLPIENQEAMLILKKLHKDEYAELFFETGQISGKPTIATCVISFEGKVFIEQGGYVIYDQITRQKIRTQNLKDGLLIVGTWLAGIGAIALVFWEIYKRYCLGV